MQELEACGVMPGRMLARPGRDVPPQQRFDADGAVIALDRVVTAKVYVTVE